MPTEQAAPPSAVAGRAPVGSAVIGGAIRAASVSSDRWCSARRPARSPTHPGSYQFKDRDGRVIYVGKAKSLRQRLSNYFAKPASLPPRTASMVAAAETVEWIQVRNDVEALMLENTLIKSHQPRFNVRLRDDKSYPFLAVTLDDEWPRPMVMRGRKRKGVRYFGPYGHAYAIRETLDLLLRTFPLRTCSDNKFDQHQRLGRPVPAVPHREVLRARAWGRSPRRRTTSTSRRCCEFLDGDTDSVVQELETRMHEAAGELEFEQAARLRDRLTSVQKAIEKQQMVAERSEDFDVLGIADDELEAAVQVFFVRKGRVVGRKGFIVDKVEDLTPGGAGRAASSSGSTTTRRRASRRRCWCRSTPTTPTLYEEWLTLAAGLEGARCGCPSAATKRELQETVTRNAQEEFVRHRLRRASDHNSRARALNELQEHLGLPEAPLRIECYDMSHIQGSDYVGSMVVLEDGLPKKSEYRRFKIKGDQGNDDFAAMEQVLTRRLTAYLAERRRPVERDGRASSPTRRSSSSSTAARASSRGRPGARGARPGRRDPGGVAGQAVRGGLRARARRIRSRLPRQSEALYLLQRIRDEAHRFAITYHRELRGKRMTTSVLDGIPGLGEVRKKRLVKELGGVRAVKAGHARGPPGAAVAARRRRPRPCTTRSTAPRPDADASMLRVHGRVSAAGETSGRRTPAGGRTGSPRAPTPSTRSRSSRWPPSTSPGPIGCSTSGCGEGQVARLAAAGRRGARASASTPPGPRWRWPPERGGRRRPTPEPERRPLPVRRREPSTRWWRAWCSSTSGTSTTPSPRSARVLEPGGRFLFFLNHPLLQTPNSGWIDDQILDPPEQYWRIGPYLVEDETIEEVEKGVFIPFIHRPLSRYLNALARQRAHPPAHGGAGAAARVPRPGGGVRGGRHHPAPAVPPVREGRWMRWLAPRLFLEEGAPGDRLAATRAAVAVGAMVLCLSLAIAFSMPSLFGNDERAHLGYVAVLLRGDLPTVDTPIPVEPGLEVLGATYPDRSDTEDRDDVWVANHPPLAHLVAAPLVWVGRELGPAWVPPMVLRVVSSALMALGVLASVAVADALAPGRPSRSVLVAAVVGLTPMVVSVAALGQTDGAGFVVGTALLAVTLRLVRRAPRPNAWRGSSPSPWWRRSPACRSSRSSGWPPSCGSSPPAVAPAWPSSVGP